MRSLKSRSDNQIVIGSDHQWTFSSCSNFHLLWIYRRHEVWQHFLLLFALRQDPYLNNRRRNLPEILTLSSRLPEAVDQKIPALCSFFRLGIGMPKIPYQSRESDVETNAQLLPFGNIRPKGVKYSRTAKLFLSISTRCCVILSSIRRCCEANVCDSSHLWQVRDEISRERSLNSRNHLKSAMFPRSLSTSASSWDMSCISVIS